LKEEKIIHNKENLKEVKTTKLLLQKILKGVPHREKEDKHKENTGKN
jgi:hypothetical protein